MDYQAIATLVTGVGFPCTMCIIIFIYMTKQLEAHKEETNGLKDALTELKIAITTLTNKVEGKTNENAWRLH